MHISELDLTAKKIKEDKKTPTKNHSIICMVKVMTFILEMFVT